jgi:4-hydroxyphenylpyruvate dioxygenase
MFPRTIDAGIGWARAGKDDMIPAISQVCSLDSPFAKDVEDYAAGHCPAIELWLTKLERFLEDASLDDFRQLLDRNGIAAPVASLQGGLLSSQGEARREAWDLFGRRLELCRQLGIEVFVVACDVTAPLGTQDLRRVQASLRQVAEQAAQHGMRVALEPQARAALGNNLQTAVSLVEEVGSPALGICLDVFHFFVGPSKMQDLALLNSQNLLHVQLCDLADVPRELASDSDRILPGDGDFPLEPLIDHLRSIGYERCVSLELMNPQLWQIPALQVGEIGVTALRRLLGQNQP